MEVKHKKNIWQTLISIILFISTGIGISYAASSKICYQGQLRESGVPITESKSMTFRIFTSSSGGSAAWNSGAQSVSVNAGLFRVILEPTSINWENTLYLEVEVDGVTLTPREELTASAYAINSQLLSGKSYTNAASSPTTPSDGDLWLDTSGDVLYVWSGSNWDTLSGGSSGGISTVEEDDSTVDSSATNLDFLGANFNVTSSPAGEANISLDGSSVTLKGNIFNVANGLVSLDSSGRLTIGASGTPIVGHLSATASLDFGTLLGLGCESLTVTVTGASDGDTVYVGVPDSLASIGAAIFTAFVSAADTVTVKRCGLAVDATDPPSTTVRVDVWQH